MAVATIAVAAPHAAAVVTISTQNAAYVGKVAGSRAFVAVVSDGAEACVYLCDSAAIPTWFNGPISANAFSLSNEGLSIDGSVTGRAVDGTVTFADGTRHGFHAVKAPPTRTAGLFRGELIKDNHKIVGGWIVLPSRQVRGLIEQDNVAVRQPAINTSGIIAVLVGRRAIDIAGIGSLQISDGTSNTRR